jgi:hypothetical protein
MHLRNYLTNRLSRPRHEHGGRWRTRSRMAARCINYASFKCFGNIGGSDFGRADLIWCVQPVRRIPMHFDAGVDPMLVASRLAEKRKRR